MVRPLRFHFYQKKKILKMENMKIVNETSYQSIQQSNNQQHEPVQITENVKRTSLFVGYLC